MSRKGNPAIVSWSGDWRCACGSQNKLWDQCVCGQPSPCREWVRGNCSMPKCRFPHPPFKIPEHLPKPADPIANPPAAAAKQKAVAQAHAAAMAAERNPLCKEMAIVTWLGHWQCNCGKVHKLWDACKCGQQPPCREWVRGQCDLPKCRFPHPPFAIPSNLPKPDDPIANPTPEQLAIPLQNWGEAAGAVRQQKVAALAPLATANGKVESGSSAAAGSGGSTPLAGGEVGGLPNPSVFGAVGQPVPVGGANGHKAEPAAPPPPPPSTTKPGVSFRAALLKSAAAAAAAGGVEHAVQEAAAADGPHAEHAPAYAAAEAEQQEAGAHAQHEHEGFQAQRQSSEGEQHMPQLATAAGPQHMSPQQAAAEEQAQQQVGQQAGTQEEQQQAHEGLAQPQQNGTLDPVVAAPVSARSNAAAAAATAGLGWNPMAQGVFSPIGPPGAQPESPSAAAAAAAAAGQPPPPTAVQQTGQQAQQGGAMQLPPAPAPVATHAPSTLPPGQQASLPAAGPSPRVPGPGMLQPQQQQPGAAHLGPSAMSPRLGGMQQAQQGMMGGVGSAMSPRSFMSQQAAGMGGVGAPAMSPRFLGAGASAARPPLGLQMSGGAGAGGPGGAGTGGLKPTHLAALHSNGMGGLGVQPGLGSGAPGQQHAAAAVQQQYTLHAALQQMALQQQQQQLNAQQQKPVAVIAKTLLEYGLMDPAFYHALRQVDFLPDGYYQQDTLTLEDQQRRMELFNAAVDSYIAAGVDNRSMLEIACQAKIGLTGGPLYYRCANCGQPIPTEMRQRWCAVCKVTPFCSPECHHRLYQQHRGVCNSMLTKPLLPSQIALRIAIEIYNVHGLTGAALHQAILRQTAAVQRSYAAAAAAAAAAGVVDE